MPVKIITILLLAGSKCIDAGNKKRAGRYKKIPKELTLWLIKPLRCKIIWLRNKRMVA
tara:strand:- start:1220 stop:1393 length:174 start_codon:yes stop_codon:yes gene_type:complete